MELNSRFFFLLIFTYVLRYDGVKNREIFFSQKIDL